MGLLTAVKPPASRVRYDFKSTAALELYLRNIYHASSTIGEKLEASREWRQLRVAWEDGMRKKGVSGHEKLDALKTSLGTLQQKLQDLSTKLGQLKRAPEKSKK